jgi:hypothetical protein
VFILLKSGFVFDWNKYSQNGFYGDYPVLYCLLIPCVLLRDCYCCRVCGRVGYWKITEGSGWFCSDGQWFIGILRMGSVRLVVHHLDGDKDNSDLDNLVTVCNRCHCWLGKVVHGTHMGMYMGFPLWSKFRWFWRLMESSTYGAETPSAVWCTRTSMT